MENSQKNAQRKLDDTKNMFLETVKKHKGPIIGIVVLVIIVLNIFWNMMESKMSAELQAVRADLGELNTRMEEVDKGTIDLDAVKADIESIKSASANFDVKLNALIKAEETKIETMIKDVENQKAYVEELKSLLAGTSDK